MLFRSGDEFKAHSGGVVPVAYVRREVCDSDTECQGFETGQAVREASNGVEVLTVRAALSTAVAFRAWSDGAPPP